MNLSDYLVESGISMDLTGKDKDEILTNLVGILGKTATINDTSAIVKMLVEREKLKTTGIGSGIAIPHCKSPEVNKVHIVIGLSKNGIDFEALDEKPANFFFLLVAPEDAGSEHLKASAKIVRLIRDTTVREDLLKLKTSKEVIDYIKAKE
ncbi:MAG: PTS sugar transporter subunit IIA [Proteobacteria bacterium]|nr:PTS sugar transporter subunit IIA [Pseudomonadota bacterium]